MTTVEEVSFKKLEEEYKAQVIKELINLRNRNVTYNDCIKMISDKFQVVINKHDVDKATLQDKEQKISKKKQITLTGGKSRSKMGNVTKSLILLLLIISVIYISIPYIGTLISHPIVYPIFYWITYFSTIIGVFTIAITLGWYSRVRTKFSSPVKKSAFSATRIVLIFLGVVVVIQIIVSIFNEGVLHYISFYLLVISLVFQGIRTVLHIFLSMNYRNKHQITRNKPLVSILIPTYNEEKVIENSINSLLRLSYRRKEIIVIDDGSRDNTLKIVRDIAIKEPIKVISKTNGGKWSALNEGIRESRGEILVCIDADTILERNAIESMIPHFNDQNIAAVAGNIKVGNRHKMLTKIQALEYVLDLNIQRRGESTLGKITVVPGPLGAFRKSVIEEVGLYSGDTFAEDSDLTMKILKAGYKIKYEKRAFGYTEAPDTFLDLAKQRYRWYRGQMQTVKKHIREIFSVPWVFFDGIVLSWFSFFTVLWLIVLMFNPFSSFVIYNPQPISSMTIMSLDFFKMSPLLYIFWHAVFFMFDVCVAIYAIKVDIKESPKLLVHIIMFKIFYVNLMDTLRIMSQLEEYLHYPMRWEITKRSGKITHS